MNVKAGNSEIVLYLCLNMGCSLADGVRVNVCVKLPASIVEMEL